MVRKNAFVTVMLFLIYFLYGSVGSAQESFLEKIWNEKEIRFPHHYSGLIGGYSDMNELFFGANYAYVPCKIGFYGSFMYGLDNSYFANIGPIVRLTDSYSTSVDVQFFQGIGLYNGHLEGESGIRFGFGRDKRYGKWSLSGSFNYSSVGRGFTVGLSWPLAGITAASAAIVIYAVAIAYTENAASATSSNRTRSSSSQSKSDSSTKSNSGSNCDAWQDMYDSQVRWAKSDYESYKDAKEKVERNKESELESMYLSDERNARKAFMNSRNELRKIRRDAEKCGCTIIKSEYETK